MRAPSCLLDVLLHAGMSPLSRYLPGFGLLLCPGGTPGAELEHAPASLFPVHLSPLGAVHATALPAVAPTNIAAPRTTPRMRFFITLPFLASWTRPFDLPRHMDTRSSPHEARARYGRRPRSVHIATRCVVVSVTCVESMGFRGRARRRRRPRRRHRMPIRAQKVRTERRPTGAAGRALSARMCSSSDTQIARSGALKSADRVVVRCASATWC
jgi:hypothetical protein